MAKKTQLLSVDRSALILSSLTDVLNIKDKIEAVFENGKLLSIIIPEDLDSLIMTPSYELKAWILVPEIVNDLERELWDIEHGELVKIIKEDERLDAMRDSEIEATDVKTRPVSVLDWE